MRFTADRVFGGLTLIAWIGMLVWLPDFISRFLLAGYCLATSAGASCGVDQEDYRFVTMGVTLALLLGGSSIYGASSLGRQKVQRTDPSEGTVELRKQEALRREELVIIIEGLVMNWPNDAARVHYPTAEWAQPVLNKDEALRRAGQLLKSTDR